MAQGGRNCGKEVSGGRFPLCLNDQNQSAPILVGKEEEAPNKRIKIQIDSLDESVAAHNQRPSKGGGEFSIPVNNVEGENASSSKPSLRFTRSVLKTTAVSSTGVLLSPEPSTAISTGPETKSNTTPRCLEMKMSKKIALQKHPANVKDLFDTGLLDGLVIHYGLKSRKSGRLKGIVKDGGIVCFCAACKGCQVISAYNFEKHAGSGNKNPSIYIFLENGKNLREILNACKSSPLETLDEIIKTAVSCPASQISLCHNCKEPLSSSHTTKAALFCNSCLASNESFTSPSQELPSNARSKKSVMTPESPSCASGSERISSQVTTKRKLIRKDILLHKLVFEEDGLPDGTELAYYVRGRTMLEGYKKGLGIFCHHCESEVSPSQFEAHAGYASRRRPYLNIFTSTGVSLHELSVSLSKSQNSSSNDNDDRCSYCADFGNLLGCDVCPRAFHQDCLGLSTIPDEIWYCPYCVSMYARESCHEYVSGVDLIEQITIRCNRVVEITENEIGGCVLCRHHDFSKSGFGPSTVIPCDQCEKEYHVGCLKDHKMADLKAFPEGKWFCCTECHRIHTALSKLVAHGSERLPDSLLKVIKRNQKQICPVVDPDFDVSWRVLSGKMMTPESKLLLAKAVTIFHDQFDPIIDASTGRDLIPSIVYGRNLRDHEFGGTYCVVLMVNYMIVSTAILRIFGQDIAEIPLVATNSDNQGRGYFQTLFSCIERLLGFLYVKNMVLPAAEESQSIWTNKFGFKMIPPDQLMEYRNNYPMITFQGTSVLQKPVPKFRIVDRPSSRSL